MSIFLAKSLPMLSSLSVAILAALPTSAAAQASANVAPRVEAELARMQQNARAAWLRDRDKRPLPHVSGSDLVVTSCEDDGSPGTLRSVVESAQSGDVVDLTGLTCATIALTQGYIVDNFEVPGFIIQGPGMNVLTISGSGSSGIFYHAGSGLLEINDVSLADGYAEDSWGGCLIAPGGGLALTRVMVSGCEAHQATLQHGSNAMGGGVMAFGELDIVKSVIASNTLFSDLADAGSFTDQLSGGGAFSLTGPLTITGSVIANNTILSMQPIQGEMHGGGADCMSCEVSVTGSVFSNNSLNSGFVDEGPSFSRLEGAGLSVESGDLTVTDSTFDDNSIYSSIALGHSYGGGIFFGGTGASISSSTVSNNYAMGRGAGVFDHAYSLNIADSTISGNHAVNDVGALYAVSLLEVDNSTIAFNMSDQGTGGFANYAQTTLESTIIANNVGQSAPDVEQLGHGSISGSHNFVGVPGSAPLPDDTLFGDPELEPLADNGGPTLTHALAATSPAIDAGSNPLALDFDQRGESFPRVNGGAADIGAYESGTPDQDTIFSGDFDP